MCVHVKLKFRFSPMINASIEVYLFLAEMFSE